jgi:hypothetical protein
VRECELKRLKGLVFKSMVLVKIAALSDLEKGVLLWVSLTQLRTDGLAGLTEKTILISGGFP